MAIASSKTLWFLIPTVLLHFSPAKAAIKGGYWYNGTSLAVADINSTLFTHLFCAFADLDATTSNVTIASSNAARFSTFTQTVQAKNPSVKTLLSIGGGGGSALAARFSNMASQAATRKAFIDSSIRLARANNFHGLDLDWEYPSSDADKSNFVSLIKEWRAAVTQESRSSGKQSLLLSAAVAGSDQISPLQYYSGPDMANNFDFINLMTYDLFPSDAYPTSTQPPAPLYNPRGLFSVDQGVMTWNKTVGVPLGKMALGLPFYGYKWTLANSNSNGLFAAASQGLGAVGYRDIKSVGATPVYNSSFVTNYCSKGTDWYGYDDVQSVTAKVSYAKGQLLFGYFAWQVAGDNNWALSTAASQAWGA
ncbi:hypothetical protein Fmac_008747 [Flemingia macrophylla]|uniref:GH18 domain-containing protein n=1 Tax=Flemingia macrophylla TaxID=520843 RepID=A0ABD1MYA7_9FABA